MLPQIEKILQNEFIHNLDDILTLERAKNISFEKISNYLKKYNLMYFYDFEIKIIREPSNVLVIIGPKLAKELEKYPELLF